MKKKVFMLFGVIVVIGLLWLVAWGDFDEWRYSKNLHCAELQNPRKIEICKSIEKYQEYEFFGHAMISAGYRSSFTTTKKAWCELSLTEADFALLEDMKYDYGLSSQLRNGSSMLYNLLDANLNPDSNLYLGSVYGTSSSDYLIRDGCPK